MALSTVIERAVVLVYPNVNGSLRTFLNTTLSPIVEATPKYTHISRDTVHVMWSALSEQPLGDASFVRLNHFVSLIHKDVFSTIPSKKSAGEEDWKTVAPRKSKKRAFTVQDWLQPRTQSAPTSKKNLITTSQKPPDHSAPMPKRTCSGNPASFFSKPSLVSGSTLLKPPHVSTSPLLKLPPTSTSSSPKPPHVSTSTSPKTPLTLNSKLQLFPKSSVEKKTSPFPADLPGAFERWRKGRPWLTFDRTVDRVLVLLCLWCKEHGRAGGGHETNAWSETGCTRVKLQAIKDHEVLIMHRESADAEHTKSRMQSPGELCDMVVRENLKRNARCDIAMMLSKKPSTGSPRIMSH